MRNIFKFITNNTFLILTVSLFSFILFSSMQISAEESLVSIKVINPTQPIPVSGEATFKLLLKIKNNWHINSHKPKQDFLIATDLDLKSDSDFSVKNIVWPKAEALHFSFFEESVLVYSRNVTVLINVLIPDKAVAGKHKIPASLTYQGCNNKTCIQPNTISFALNYIVSKSAASKKEVLVASTSEEKLDVKPQEVNVATNTNNNKAVLHNEKIPKKVTKENEEVPQNLTSGELKIREIIEKGIFSAIIFFFITGLSLNLTPCVYPVIPITISFFGSQSEKSQGSKFFIAFIYTLGIALVFTLLGLISSLAGKQWGFLFQNPWFIALISLIMFSMAASMFGAFEIQIPSSLMTKLGQSREGIFGALIMGLTVGVVIAPCAAGIIIGLVGLVAKLGLVVKGTILFFFMGLGLGLPYLILASFSGFLGKIPRSGMWMTWVKKLFGVLLVGVGVYFLLPLSTRVSNQFSFYLGMITIFGGLYLGFLDHEHGYSKGFNIGRGIFGIIIIIIGVFVFNSALATPPSPASHEKTPINWISYSAQDINKISADFKKPTIIDFTADWCAPCRAMKTTTFMQKDVVKLSKNFTMITVDATSETPNVSALMKKYSVRGMPTIIFLNTKGNEIPNLRVVEYINAEEFFKRMQQVKN